MQNAQFHTYSQPWTNCITTPSDRFEDTRFLKRIPKDRYYRKQLIPFLYKPVQIFCENFQLTNREGEGYYDKILLTDVHVIDAPKNMKLFEPVYVDHLWVAVDTHWRETVKLKNATAIICNGEFCEYRNSRGKKNIGFRLYQIQLQYK